MSYVGNALQRVALLDPPDATSYAKISSGATVVVSEVTRSASTSPYTANYIAGSLFTFSNVVPFNGSGGIITQARLMMSDTSVPATLGGFRLTIFDASQSVSDNTVRDFSYSSIRDNSHGYIDFATPEDIGSCLRALTTSVNLQFKAGSSSKDIYGVLETKAVYTPQASTKFAIALHIAHL